MTYVSKKEKVFDLPDQGEGSSLSLVRGSDHRLKIFPSVCERGSASLEDGQKFQHLCGLLSGKESNCIKSPGFKYIPIDVLLTVLMAEKDAYIQELLERQEKCTCGDRTEVLFKANRFDDSEDDKEALIRKDAEMVALKNRNAVLESELEECRDTLRKAMHKLESVEAILNENICLNEKVKCADEMIKLLEENKRALEMELQNRDQGDCDEFVSSPETWAEENQNLQSLYNEKDILKREIETLQKELLKAKTSIQEMDSLNGMRQPHMVLRNLDELSKENECFKKKLEAVKKLEKFVEDLKKQAVKLTEKYERESHRANEQMKQLNIWAKELQILREEKSRLQQKVIELSSLESEYYSLKNKMAQVDLVIEENCALNTKLTELDRLENENDQLRSEIERLKSANTDLNESKTKIINMEYELKAQENKIKDLTSEIQILKQEYVQHDDYNRLKTEIQEKTDKLKIKEEELKEVPVLKSQIEQLYENLQKCKDDLKTHNMLSEKLQEELEVYKNKCYELEELTEILKETYIAMRYEEKVEFQGSFVQELENESYPILELREIEVEPKEEQAQENEKFDKEKEENDRNANYQDLNEMLERIDNMKELLSQKDERVRTLESDLEEMRNSLSNCIKCQDLKNHSTKLQDEINTLQEENNKLESQLNSKLEEEVRIEKLEHSLAFQKKAVKCYEDMLKETESKLMAEIEIRKTVETLLKIVKEESFLSRKEISTRYLTEIDILKNDINKLKILSAKLRQENKMLHKIKTFTEVTGKRALENVLCKLREKLIILQNLSEQELQSECQALHAEVKRLLDEADDLKLCLEEERKSKDLLEKKLNLIQKELSIVTNARIKVRFAETQTCPLIDQSEEIKKTLQDIETLKKENEEFVKEITVLQAQCKDFQEEVTLLHENLNEINRNYGEERHVTRQQKDEINALNEKLTEFEKEADDWRSENEDLNKKLEELQGELNSKEAEIENMRKELLDVKNELIKLTSEFESLQKKEIDKCEEKSKEDSEEKENSTDIVNRVEKEFEDLRRKLENCSTSEEKLLVLKTKRDNLIVKVNNFESEVNFLKQKLNEYDSMRTELEELKAERKSLKNFQMNAENEEKLLSDIFGLREQLKLQLKEIENARSENTNLKKQLQDLGKMLEVCKKSHMTIRDCSPKSDMDITVSKFSENDSVSDNTIRVDSSTSCEKLSNITSIEEFKMEIDKTENKYKFKIQKLKEGNAEKIKKLMEQYEKESKNRSKTYNESLISIKSYYESDIRKLVEKHKSSILRLQNLHEDEVQELNTNYETQMEAMQTLNENVVNDLTSGAAEKCKLAEKYNKEIKEIEAKFQNLLKEKENQYMIEIANLQNDLNRNANDLKELHKEDIENLSRLYEKNIAQIEAKHNKELKKFKKNNAKRTEMMKLKYEDLLNEERKKYEEQLQIMMERLKMGQKGDQAQEDIKLVYLKQKPVAHSEPTEFNKILQKILMDGLESLKFDELMLIHCKTCFTTEKFFDELNLKMKLETNLIGDGCPHLPLLREDKKQLLKRIFILEKEIAIKQLETHEAIINMETAEKCRIEELNTLLRNEREKNAELKILLSSQTRAQTDLKIESYMLDRQASLHETNFIEKVKELEVERAEKRCLEEELQKEKNNSKHLTLLLESERQRFRSQRQKDSDYIEAMRMRLEEALNHEQIMESQLDYEAQFRTKLEFELQSLQRSFNLIVDQPQSTVSLESKVVKDIKNLDRFELEKEENLRKIKNRNKVKPHTPT